MKNKKFVGGSLAAAAILALQAGGASASVETNGLRTGEDIRSIFHKSMDANCGNSTEGKKTSTEANCGANKEAGSEEKNSENSGESKKTGEGTCGESTCGGLF